MTSLSVRPEVGKAFAGWRLGLLEFEGLGHRGSSEALDREVGSIEERIRAEYHGLGRRELATLASAAPYAAHFGRAGKAYPVLLQLEAVASKGRSIAFEDPLVRALFAAELESLLLFAGHDSATFASPLSLEVASGAHTMPTLGGALKTPPPGDLVLRDRDGIVASVLLGPDARTAIGTAANSAIFVAYVPPTIDTGAIRAAMGRLATFVAMICPDSKQVGEELLEL